MYIIRNKDGSIRKAYVNEYVQQGSNNVNYIDMAIDGLNNGSWTADCLFELPNGEVVQLAGTQKEFIVDNETFSGYRVYLSSAVLSYAGLLKVVARNYDANGNILYSYPFKIMINATSLDASYDAPITIAQYNSFMALLATYINAYDTHLIRRYDTLAIANADISNITTGEHIMISNGKSGYSIYYKANSTDTALTFVASQGGGSTGDYVTFNDYMTDKTSGVAKAIPTSDISNLTNVYIKDGFLYAKGGDSGIVSVIIVDTLPDVGQTGVLYLVPVSDASSKNKYDEYMWINNAWEEIGTSSIDVIDSAFVIKGDISDTGSITFDTSLDIAKLLSYVENRQCIVFTPNNKTLPSLNLAIQETSTGYYALTGSYIENDEKNTLCYSVAIIFNSATITGSYTYEFINQLLDTASATKIGGVKVNNKTDGLKMSGDYIQVAIDDNTIKKGTDGLYSKQVECSVDTTNKVVKIKIIKGE